MQLKWTFRLCGVTVADWRWEQRGAPPLEDIEPVRRPQSSEHHRHVPVSAYSMTNGGIVSLESGLEHDLVRRVDRDPRVTRIVPQPFKLTFRVSSHTGHTPDVLTCYEDGSVEVWDARPTEEQDDDFKQKTAVTRDACTAVGWRYSVFSGLEGAERLNLMWLNGFRHRPAWTDRVESTVRQAAGRPLATLGSLFADDDGTGELKSVVWHLVWLGHLVIDMTTPWELDTNVALRRSNR